MTAAALGLPPVRDRIRHQLVVDGTKVDLVLDVGSACSQGVSAAAARLAEELVADTLGVPVRAVRVAGLMPSGRPVAALVDGRDPPMVSIAHVAGLIGAAVSPGRSVGLDIVDVHAAVPALDCWSHAAELALPGGNPALLRARIWSAKEAAYKAACLDEPFQPLRTVVTGSAADRFTWMRAATMGPIVGHGRWLHVEDWIIAIAAASRIHRGPVHREPGAIFTTGAPR